MIGIEVVFRCRLSWCNGSHAGPGGDDERTVGTGERGSHRLNGFPVGFAVCDKLREVVVEGGMDDAVRHGCSTVQAVQVFQIASKHFGTRRHQGLGACFRSAQSKYLMAGLDEFGNNDRTDETGRAGNKNTHDEFTFVSVEDFCCRPMGLNISAYIHTINAIKSVLLVQSSGDLWIRYQMCCRCSNREVMSPGDSRSRVRRRSNGRSIPASSAMPWYPVNAGYRWKVFPKRYC